MMYLAHFYYREDTTVLIKMGHYMFIVKFLDFSLERFVKQEKKDMLTWDYFY